MKCIGLLDKKIKRFQSYLAQKTFFISLENAFSEAGTVKCGVPLYIIYILQALSNSHTYLYADEVSMTFFYQYEDVTEIENILKKNLQMYAIGLLIISYQFILEKIKLNEFSTVRKKMTRT